MQSLTKNISPHASSSVHTKSGSKGHSVKLHSAMASHFECILCGEEHLLSKCTTFKALSAQKRLDLANERDLCKNRLSNDRKKSKCKNQLNCLKCKKRHDTMLY